MVIKVIFKDTTGAQVTDVTNITFVHAIDRSTNTNFDTTGITVSPSIAGGYFYFTYSGDNILDWRLTGHNTGNTITYIEDGSADPAQEKIHQLLVDYTVSVPISVSNPNTYTVLDSSQNPLYNTIVWVTTDVGGITVAGSPRLSDAQGRVIFDLPGGATYYVWKKKTGYVFTNPQSWVIGA
jgi:hypothetical protein